MIFFLWGSRIYLNGMRDLSEDCVVEILWTLSSSAKFSEVLAQFLQKCSTSMSLWLKRLRSWLERSFSLSLSPSLCLQYGDYCNPLQHGSSICARSSAVNAVTTTSE